MFGWIENAVNQVGSWIGLDTRSRTEKNVENLNERAFQHELERYRYEKDLQQTMFNREDNAVQRRVADLKAAGMSPVLAAGQGANAGQEISRSSNVSGALQNQAAAEQAVLDRRMQVANQVMNMVGMFSSISHTQAQTDAIRFEMGEKFERDTRYMERKALTDEARQKVMSSLAEFQKGKLSADTALAKVRLLGVPAENAGRMFDALQKGFDLKTSIKFGLRKSDHFSAGVKDLTSLLNTMSHADHGFSPSVDAEMQKLLKKAIGDIGEIYTPLQDKVLTEKHRRDVEGYGQKHGWRGAGASRSW